jgi:Protein of unknown function (DUF3306)
MADRDRPTRAGDEAEGFLHRWSRRKAEARSAPAAAPPAASDDSGPAAETAPASAQEVLEQDAPVDLKDLPDIATLDASSDFSVFMRPGVPAHLRTLALRKLWRSDPIFSKLDGLVEYGEDYTIPSWPKGAIKTAYRIGRGFVNELEKLEPAKAEPELLEPEGAPAPEPESTVASTIQKPPAGSPAEPLQPMPAPPASSEAQLVPDPTSGPVKASGPTRRRPPPRRG